MTTYISQNAFWGLLISAVEVYKRECFGLLIGYRDRRGTDESFIVEHAVPFQSAGRKHKGVVSNPRAHKRIERFLANIPHLSVIGDFHSHTMWGYSRAASHPSETDLQGMAPDNVYIIVSVNDRLRVVPWNYNDDGSLSGTTDAHHFRLTAYTVNGAREPKRTPILCPYAIGFDVRPLRAVR
jgi:proteasome lid subunit RPN8/RPN11